MTAAQQFAAFARTIGLDYWTGDKPKPVFKALYARAFEKWKAQQQKEAQS